MELTPLLIYESFILIIGVSAVLAFAAFYYRLLKGYTLLRQDYIALEAKTKKDSAALLEDSQQQAIRIIRESRVLSEELKEKLATILTAAAKSEGKAYEEVLEGVEEDLKRESLSKVDAFAKSLEKETVSSQHEIEKRLESAYAAVDTEVEMVKKAKLAKLDTQIAAIVTEVISASTGKVVSLQDHDDWIRKALKDATKQAGL